MKYLLLALSLFTTPALAQEAAPSQAYVSVTGEAVEKIAPDLAVLSVTAQGDDKTLAGAKDIANKKLKTVLDVAKKFGIEGEHLKATLVQVSPRYRYVQQSGKQVLEAYTASASLELTLSDITRLGALTDALVEAGIEQVSGQFSLKDPQKAREDMLAKAVEDAHRRAEALARAAGAKLGKPLSISDSGGSIQAPVVPSPRMAMAKADMEVSPELPAGLVEVRQQVSVSYGLE
jgi:uncharacterized protein YggE